MQKFEWAVTDEELRVRGGLYQIARIGDGWSARYRALRDGQLGRCVDVHTLDAEGNAKPWPTRGIAKMACDSHHERMANHGESADLASAWVARNTDMFEGR